MPVHPIEYRYGSNELREIFDIRNKILLMAKVEATLAEVQAEFNIIPKEAADAIRKAASEISYEDVKEEEKITKHETMALARALAKKAGPYGEYVHLGVTSNDIIDTSMALQIKMAGGIIIRRSVELLESIVSRGEEVADIVALGRTHGVVADPIPLSFKFAYWSYLVRKSLERFVRSLDESIMGKISGAVGTMAAMSELTDIDPQLIQQEVLDKLNLKPADISTQIVPRDALANLITTIATFSSALDTIANEIRNLHRTEIGELEEFFEEESQVGSSTMPHKRNPIRSEKVCGLARIVRSLSIAALENMVLEHERDLTNSSAERCFVPEAFLLLEEQIMTLTSVIRGLRVRTDRIKDNLTKYADLSLSERFMIALVKKGVGRQTAHEIIRRISIEAYRSGKKILDVLREDSQVSKYLTREEIEILSDPSTYIGKGREIAKKEFERAKSFLAEVLTYE
ncbi:MAG: adenylosuccinate lyase [Candidatus Korarchaeota archaeon]|nr:adenylosuccinate lyase [Candidatus Korarchaeota archaeon]